MMMFTHLLIEAKSKYSQNLKPYSRTHEILDSVEGFSHVSLNYNSFPPIRIKTKPLIFILKRRDAYTDQRIKSMYIAKEDMQVPEDMELQTDTIDLQTDIKKDESEDIDRALDLPTVEETPEIAEDVEEILMIQEMLSRELESKEFEDDQLIDLNIEPTEDIEEEVHLSKLMRMSREDLIKELNKVESRPKLYSKSGNVRKNIKKIIRQYKTIIEDEELKPEEITQIQVESPTVDKVELETALGIDDNYSETTEEIHETEEKIYEDKITVEEQEVDNQDIEEIKDRETIPDASESKNLTETEEQPEAKLKKGKKKGIKKKKTLEHPVIPDNLTDETMLSGGKIAPMHYESQVVEIFEDHEDTEDIESSSLNENQTTEKEKISESENDTIPELDISVSDSENKTVVNDSVLPEVKPKKKKIKKNISNTVNDLSTTKINESNLQETPPENLHRTEGKTKKKVKKQRQQEHLHDTDGNDEENINKPSETDTGSSISAPENIDNFSELHSSATTLQGISEKKPKRKANEKLLNKSKKLTKDNKEKIYDNIVPTEETSVNTDDQSRLLLETNEEISETEIFVSVTNTQPNKAAVNEVTEDVQKELKNYEEKEENMNSLPSGKLGEEVVHI